MRENKVSSSGVREARSEDCADVRADWGRSSKCCLAPQLGRGAVQCLMGTFLGGGPEGIRVWEMGRMARTRVVCRTLARRG